MSADPVADVFGPVHLVDTIADKPAFVIVHHGAAMLRFGPMSFAEALDRGDWCKANDLPWLTTVEAGAFDESLAKSFVANARRIGKEAGE